MEEAAAALAGAWQAAIPWAHFLRRGVTDSVLFAKSSEYVMMAEKERGPVADLNDDIAAYASMQAQLEAEHMGEWAVVYNRALIGTFSSFEAAAEEAVKRFGRGPYLIRQIGAPPVVLPASVMYCPSHADSSVRVG